MIIVKDFESPILAGHTPNFIQLGEVEDYLFVRIEGSFIESLDLKLKPYNGEVVLNIYDITKQLYLSIPEYQDPFEYEQSEAYNVNNAYHIGYLNIYMYDNSIDYNNLNSEQINQLESVYSEQIEDIDDYLIASYLGGFEKNLTIINSALQVNECITMSFYENRRLGVFCNASEIQDLYQFDYELQSNLH